MRFVLLGSFLCVTASAWTTGSLAFNAETSQCRSTTTTTTLFGAASSTRSISPTVGTVVTVECRLVPEGDFVPEPLIDGVVLHQDDPPEVLTFVLGRGNFLPGLHEVLLGMNVGEELEGISLDAGWGDRNPNLIATASFQDTGIEKSRIQIGSELYLANGMTATVTDIQDETFTIDANPPLAGASYRATIKLLSVDEGPTMTEYTDYPVSTSKYQVATFALGCFWGGELEFMREQGVLGTAVGYTQGNKENPTYQEVCTGTTGHTEAIAVTYDPTEVPYEKLVQLAMDRLGENKYLKNQVGNDKGTQYRHGVYYHSPEQKAISTEVVGSYGDDCVTEVLPAKKFWYAEDYHQQYLLKGGQSARKGDDATIRCYG